MYETESGIAVERLSLSRDELARTESTAMNQLPFRRSQKVQLPRSIPDLPPAVPPAGPWGDTVSFASIVVIVAATLYLCLIRR